MVNQYPLEPLRRLTKDKVENSLPDKTHGIPITISNALAFEFIHQGHFITFRILSTKENNYNPATGFEKKSLSTQDRYI